MKDRIVRFLNDLDASLAPIAEGERLPLYHIGRSALVWKYGFSAATKDIDVVLMPNDTRLMNDAIRLFGDGTAKANEHDLFLQTVPPTLPRMPGKWETRVVEVEEQWTVIRLFHLEAHDIAVTKLLRFAPKDVRDLKEMCDLGCLTHEELEKRFVSAWWMYQGDREYDQVVANLLTIQNYLATGR